MPGWSPILGRSSAPRQRPFELDFQGETQERADQHDDSQRGRAVSVGSSVGGARASVSPLFAGGLASGAHMMAYPAGYRLGREPFYFQRNPGRCASAGRDETVDGTAKCLG